MVRGLHASPIKSNHRAGGCISCLYPFCTLHARNRLERMIARSCRYATDRAATAFIFLSFWATFMRTLLTFFLLLFGGRENGLSRGVQFGQGRHGPVQKALDLVWPSFTLVGRCGAFCRIVDSTYRCNIMHVQNSCACITF